MLIIKKTDFYKTYSLINSIPFPLRKMDTIFMTLA